MEGQESLLVSTKEVKERQPALGGVGGGRGGLSCPVPFEANGKGGRERPADPGPVHPGAPSKERLPQHEGGKGRRGGPAGDVQLPFHEGKGLLLSRLQDLGAVRAADPGDPETVVENNQTSPTNPRAPKVLVRGRGDDDHEIHGYGPGVHEAQAGEARRQPDASKTVPDPPVPGGEEEAGRDC